MSDGKPAKPGNPKAKGTEDASESDRGKFRFQKGRDGHVDYMEVCIREADGSYVWRTLTTQLP